jgi:hypothetical protein
VCSNTSKRNTRRATQRPEYCGDHDRIGFPQG